MPAEAVTKWAEKLEHLKTEITDIMQEEKEEKHVRAQLRDFLVPSHNYVQLRHAERDLKKGENMIEHEAEIYSRPARTWFQSSKDKAKSEGLADQPSDICSGR